jgi:predicted membrane chloride channel (bestrophin family)
MVLFHVPLFLIVLRLVWTAGAPMPYGLQVVPFAIISLALAAYLVYGDNSRDEYYPTLLALLAYDLVLYWYILN